MINDELIEINIETMGGMGDGIGHYKGKPVFVPLSCTGDKVTAIIEQNIKDTLRARLVEVITPSKHRQNPPCQHFGRCGGCSLQHLKPESYNNFKQQTLHDIIKRLGLPENIIHPLIEVGDKSRRRAEFKITVAKGEASLGFFAPKSHDVIEINECPVSDERLIAPLANFRACLASLKKAGILKALSLAVLDNGLDAVIITRSAINDNDKKKLAEFAASNNIIRLCEYIQTPENSHNSAAGATTTEIYSHSNATIKFGAVDVSLPVGSFLQATQKGQNTITSLVLENLKGTERVTDLYSGAGTYSFPLLNQAKSVAAYEGSSEMILAMHNAIIKNNLDGRISATTRDLFTNPLSVTELNRFDGAVINPPRNGALPQIKNIAKSNITKLVMVSCNPATFERDTKYLLDNGYVMLSATAIDQFYWSGHLEIVAAFAKKP